MWVFDHLRGSAEAFAMGYGGDALSTDDGRQRYHVALGLELLAGLRHWSRIGDVAMFRDYDRRLSDWGSTHV